MSQAALNAIFGHSDIRAGNEMDGREDKEKEWIDGRPTDGWVVGHSDSLSAVAVDVCGLSPRRAN